MADATSELRSTRLELEFSPRAEPLAISAVLARDVCAQALARRLLLLPDEQLAQLRGVASTQLLIVLGAGELIPWVEGIQYFGRDELAPELLLPTALQIDLPVQLVERALRRRYAVAGGAGPFLFCAETRLVIDTTGARRIDRGVLAAWLAAREQQADPAPKVADHEP